MLNSPIKLRAELRATYGVKRDYKKIDIYLKTGHGLRYLASTTWAKSCREARERYALANTGYAASDLSARYAR